MSTRCTLATYSSCRHTFTPPPAPHSPPCSRWQDWVQINEYLIDSGLLSADDTQFLYDLSWAVYNSSRATVRGP